MTFLKIFGMFTMLCDHIGFCFNIPILRILGKSCFPIFAFMTAYGWHMTRDKFDYIKRMMELALFSQIPFIFMYFFSGAISFDFGTVNIFMYICSLISVSLFVWFSYLVCNKMPNFKLGQVNNYYISLWFLYFSFPILYGHTNVIFTLTTALLFILVCELKNINILEKVIACSGLLLGYGIFCDYSIFGVVLVIGIYFALPSSIQPFMIYTDNIRRAALLFIQILPQLFMIIWANVMSIFYSGNWDIYGMYFGIGVTIWYTLLSKRKPASKIIRNICYWFYPIHMFLIDIVAFIVLLFT